MRERSNRTLIVNADDLGLCAGVNRGIIDAYQNGIVTRASLMVRAAAAAEAAALARELPDLGVGLHLDMAEWAYQNDTWIPLYEVVDLRDARAVAAEVDRQLCAFRELMNRDPTHVDSHQHVHRREPLTSIARDVAERLGAPLRHFGPARYCGEFYGQSTEGEPLHAQVGVDSLVSILQRLPDGLSELCCHPGYLDNTLSRSETMYRGEREFELRALCDPRMRRAMNDLEIELVRIHRAPTQAQV